MLFNMIKILLAIIAAALLAENVTSMSIVEETKERKKTDLLLEGAITIDDLDKIDNPYEIMPGVNKKNIAKLPEHLQMFSKDLLKLNKMKQQEGNYIKNQLEDNPLFKSFNLSMTQIPGMGWLPTRT